MACPICNSPEGTAISDGIRAGAGVLIAALSGVASAVLGAPYLTGLWLPINLLGTPTMFDIGVYLTVAGTLSAVALALEDGGEGH